MKLLSRFGLGLFLLGFGLWLYTLTMNQFTLTKSMVSDLIKPEHQATLGVQLTPMLNKTYTNGWAFTSDFDRIFNDLNAQYRATQQWDKVIYDEYSFAITKAAAAGPLKTQPLRWLFLTFGLAILGALLFFLPDLQKLAGIKNDGIFHKPATSRGWIGWITGTFLIGFYVLLYYYPQYLANWTMLVDPVSKLLNGGEAGRWFLYGFLYTVCVIVMGIRMLIKYRHSRYQQVRTFSVMFFQTAVAFIIPEILVSLNMPYFDFKNIWPLDYDFFFDYNLNSLIQSGHLGIFMLVWGILLFLVGVPVMTYFFGKRWYCSWVCGCGGLAETLGDPYRQLSDKSLKSWKIERYLIHGVMVFAVIMTGMVLYSYFTGSSNVLFIDSYSVRSAYGFWIGGIFAGVVGRGFGREPTQSFASRLMVVSVFLVAIVRLTVKWGLMFGVMPNAARTSFGRRV